MYCLTVSTLDSETAKAPYPDCQANAVNSGPWVLIHFDEDFLTSSSTCPATATAGLLPTESRGTTTNPYHALQAQRAAPSQPGASEGRAPPRGPHHPVNSLALQGRHN